MKATLLYSLFRYLFLRRYRDTMITTSPEDSHQHRSWVPNALWFPVGLLAADSLWASGSQPQHPPRPATMWLRAALRVLLGAVGRQGASLVHIDYGNNALRKGLPGLPAIQTTCLINDGEHLNYAGWLVTRQQRLPLEINMVAGGRMRERENILGFDYRLR